jgi:hypothetical protein
VSLSALGQPTALGGIITSGAVAREWLMGWTAPDGIKKVPNWCRVEPGKGAVREES